MAIFLVRYLKCIGYKCIFIKGIKFPALVITHLRTRFIKLLLISR